MNLQTLYLDKNQLGNIDLATLVNVTTLSLSHNQLTSIDVSPLVNLQTLSLGNNQLGSIDLATLVNVTTLSLNHNQLTTINVAPLTQLTRLILHHNQLTSLDVTSLTLMEYLNLSRNDITSLNLAPLTALKYLALSHNVLSTIDISHATQLQYLSVNANHLTTLDVRGLSQLTYLRAYGNPLTSLHTTGLTAIKKLYLQHNNLTDVSALGELTTLTALNLVDNDISCSQITALRTALPNATITASSSCVTDTDNDGMPDSWETDNGLNPNNADDADADVDQDGLTNLQEYQAGTDPNAADSDVDGIPDGWEVTYGLNPLNSADASADTDSDGLTNLEEYLAGTHPQDSAPTVVINSPANGESFSDTAQVTFDGTAIDSEDGDLSSTIEWRSNIDTVLGTGASLVTSLSAGEHVIRAIVIDSQQADAEASVAVTVTVTIPDPEPDPDVPPDPATVAPPLDPTQITSMKAATAFLYMGADPIQTGVNPDTIEETRAGVIRGKVLDRDGESLAGVTVTVKDHPEFGQTLSRVDGMFDLAVNGGGILTVNYRLDGYLPLQRQTNVLWRDYAHPDDIVMTPLAAEVTAIAIDSPVMQVAQGKVETDSRGSRRMTMLFPAGTQATMTLPDGGTQVLTSLDVRATEYTVGDRGEAAMPGPLPPTSAYTYAAELSVDAAIAVGATRVDFNQPVPFYVENFIGFPVGEPVPLGWYDRERATWVAENDGRVIAILEVNNGLALLDIDGSGLAADATALAELGISDAERQQLAQLYSGGTTLWRMQMAHFTPVDCNWPWDLPSDAIGPLEQLLEFLRKLFGENVNGCQGCLINPQEQILEEAVPVEGSPYALHYSTERVDGHKVNRVLNLQITDDTVPASLKGIELTIKVGGRVFRERFETLPNQNFTFEWDHRDAYGRLITGTHMADINIDFNYDTIYVGGWQGFGSFGRSFGLSNAGSDVTLLNAGREASVSKSWRQRLGYFQAQNVGLGGWSLSDHHWYDIQAAKLYQGNGDSYEAAELTTLQTLVGHIDGDEPDYQFSEITDQAYAADGSLYVLEGDQLVQISPTGQASIIAGSNGNCFPLNDNGPAVDARFCNPGAVAVGDNGSIYIADTDNNRIRRIDPNGIITTIAGGADVPDNVLPETWEVSGTPVPDGFISFSEIAGDGGPATEAALYAPSSIALAADGGLYIADPPTRRIRHVSPDGTIRTVAGHGGLVPSENPFSGEIAVDSGLFSPTAVALTSRGDLLIGESVSGLIHRVDANGRIATIAGGGETLVEEAEGKPATDVNGVFGFGGKIALDSVDRIYITPPAEYAGVVSVYRITENGIFQRVAGRRATVDDLDLGAPFSFKLGTEADGVLSVDTISRFHAVAITPHDEVVLAGSLAVPAFVDTDVHNERPEYLSIRKLVPAAPDFSVATIAVPSRDGGELYNFSPSGRHLKTVDTITGQTLLSFGYTEQGWLSAITDIDGDITTIQRSNDGTPTGITTADGQVTLVSLNADGYLDSLTNPAGEIYRMEYTPDGLLQRFTDRRGNSNVLVYDEVGRLARDTDAAAGGWVLNRSTTGKSTTVTMSSAENRTALYTVEYPDDGSRRQTETAPDGAQTATVFYPNGEEVTQTPDGVELALTRGADPRFGAMTSVPKSLRIYHPVRINRHGLYQPPGCSR